MRGTAEKDARLDGYGYVQGSGSEWARGEGCEGRGLTYASSYQPARRRERVSRRREGAEASCVPNEMSASTT